MGNVETVDFNITFYREYERLCAESARQRAALRRCVQTLEGIKDKAHIHRREYDKTATDWHFVFEFCKTTLADPIVQAALEGEDE